MRSETARGTVRPSEGHDSVQYVTKRANGNLVTLIRRILAELAMQSTHEVTQTLGIFTVWSAGGHVSLVRN
jgi:hypothetical protein